MYNFNTDILITLITKLKLHIIIFSENVFTSFVAKRCLRKILIVVFIIIIILFLVLLFFYCYV